MKRVWADFTVLLTGGLVLLCILVVDLYTELALLQEPTVWVPLGVLIGVGMLVLANALEDDPREAVETTYDSDHH